MDKDEWGDARQRLSDVGYNNSSLGIVVERQNENPFPASSSSSNQELKQLGRKARARLEEERMKRREIVRLNAAPTSGSPVPKTFLSTNPGAKKRGTLATSPAMFEKSTNPNTSTIKVRSRRLPTRSQLPTNKKGKIEFDSNNFVDLWIPDVSHLPKTYPKGQGSTLVQLHGVPIGCTIERIRSFFAGLEVERVIVVPRNMATISILDAATTAHARRNRTKFHKYCATSERHGQLNGAIDRYSSDNVRLFVKFSSAPIAVLATERSGEVAFLSQTTPTSKKEGAALAVTQLNKRVSSVLVNNLAVDALPGIPFHELLDLLEKQLHPIVLKLVWIKTVRELDLSLDDSFSNKDDEEGCKDNNILKLMMSTEKNKRDASSLAGYQRLATAYNTFWTHHETLMEQLPIGTNDVNNTCLHQNDPIIRLTCVACDVLESEMDHIDAILYEVRLSRQFEIERNACIELSNNNNNNNNN